MGLPKLESPIIEVDKYNTDLLKFLRRIEYRRVQSFEDFEIMGRLRGQSYNKNEFFKGFSPDVMLDDIDFQPWSYCYGVYLDGQLVTTIRLQHITPENRDSPALDYFPDIVGGLLDQGQSFIVPGRFAMDLDLEGRGLMLPLMTIRLTALALRYFKANAILSLVKKNHVAYHRRFFGATQLSPLRDIDELSEPIMMLSTGKEKIPTVFRRYPFLDGLRYEERLLFAEPELGKPQTLTILPTASEALGWFNRKQDNAA